MEPARATARPARRDTMNLANVSLEDKYRLEHGRVFLTGMQALARLPGPRRRTLRR